LGEWLDAEKALRFFWKTSTIPAFGGRRKA